MTSPSPFSEKLRQKIHLKKYLEELGALTGRTVQTDELGSLEQAAAMRHDAQKLNAEFSVACEIRFSEKNSERFKKFLQRLRDTNSSSVYVWTPRTICCGALLVPSLDAIKFDFDFTVNNEGILAFTTSDLGDSLLLDFSVMPTGEQIMKVETRGANWAKVAY